MMNYFDEAAFERLSGSRDDENWTFREFLKSCSLSQEQIDPLVQELYRQEAEEFDCQDCARCCKDSGPRLEAEDIARLVKRLDITAGEFTSKYLAVDEAYSALMFTEKPCPFLEANSCTCYPDRPKDCAEYPHLHKDRFLTRVSNMIANCTVCPIVYNVFERLKEEMKPYGWKQSRPTGKRRIPGHRR